VFLLAGLFLVSLVDDAVAGGCGAPSVAECADCCASSCEHGRYSNAQINCAGENPGEDKRECLAVERILSKCCFTDCAEGDCDIIHQESSVCEAIDQAVEDACIE